MEYFVKQKESCVHFIRRTGTVAKQDVAVPVPGESRRRGLNDWIPSAKNECRLPDKARERARSIPAFSDLNIVFVVANE